MVEVEIAPLERQSLCGCHEVGADGFICTAEVMVLTNWTVP